MNLLVYSLVNEAIHPTIAFGIDATFAIDLPDRTPFLRHIPGVKDILKKGKSFGINDECFLNTNNLDIDCRGYSFYGDIEGLAANVSINGNLALGYGNNDDWLGSFHELNGGFTAYGAGVFTSDVFNGGNAGYGLGSPLGLYSADIQYDYTPLSGLNSN